MAKAENTPADEMPDDDGLVIEVTSGRENDCTYGGWDEVVVVIPTG